MNGIKLKIRNEDVFLQTVTYSSEKVTKSLTLTECIKYLQTSTGFARIAVEAIAEISDLEMGLPLLFQCVTAQTKVPEFGTPVDPYLVITPNQPVKWLVFIITKPDEASFLISGDTLERAIASVEKEIAMEILLPALATRLN